MCVKGLKFVFRNGQLSVVCNRKLEYQIHIFLCILKDVTSFSACDLALTVKLLKKCVSVNERYYHTIIFRLPCTHDLMYGSGVSFLILLKLDPSVVSFSPCM